MDPPQRAKAQYALVSVTGVIDANTDGAAQPATSLLVDDVRLLSGPAEAEALKPLYSQMLYWEALNGQVSRKRERELWSPEENPSKANRCRILGRSPTGPGLPDYSPSPAVAAASIGG